MGTRNNYMYLQHMSMVKATIQLNKYINNKKKNFHEQDTKWLTEFDLVLQQWKDH